MAGALLLLPGAGCHGPKLTPKVVPPNEGSTTVEAPSYHDLIVRYNANIQALDRLWSRCVLAMRWRDNDGKMHFEQGEGHFMFVRPGRVALTAGKLGHTILWAGSNAAQYWLFDLQDEGKAYVGLQRNAGKPCTTPLPLPVFPRSVPYLLGLLPLDPDVRPAPRVEVLDGRYLIEPPGLRIKMLIDPKTAQPVRVDLTNAADESVVVCQLSQDHGVEVQGLPPNRQPRIATHADLFAVGREGRMSLVLADMSDGRRFNKIRPQAFDFNVLVKAYKPATVENLDKGCE